LIRRFRTMQGGLGAIFAGLLCFPQIGAAVDAGSLAVVYNQRDPHSRILAERYAKARNIPAAHLIEISLNPRNPVISGAEFKPILSDLVARVPRAVEAYALVWKMPYRVGCMSITSAFALGFDKKYCAKGCQKTAASPYYDSYTKLPFTRHGIRPAMLLTGGTLTSTERLLERGLAAQALASPRPAAYLVSSSDVNRGTRNARYATASRSFSKSLDVQLVSSDGVQSRNNVMFYFIGAKFVPALDSLQFLPGAIADHLTSAGGVLEGDAQMSAMEWIDAGATGTYGTVVEPCNFAQKFPDPVVVMDHYLKGDTLIEAYWKSVQWPGQGLFIGEPLAQPFNAATKLN